MSADLFAVTRCGGGPDERDGEQVALQRRLGGSPHLLGEFLNDGQAQTDAANALKLALKLA